MRRTISNDEIVTSLAGAWPKNAPRTGRHFIFSWSRIGPGGKQSPAVEYKVIAGSPGNRAAGFKTLPSGLCAEGGEYVSREQDEKSKRWTGIVLTLQRNGSFSLTFNYPK